MTSSERTKAKRRNRKPTPSPEPLQTKSMGMDWGWSGIAALGVTLLAGLFYATGRAWRDTFLSTLGIPAENVAIAFHDHVYVGLVIQLETIVMNWGWAVLLLMAFGVLVSAAHSSSELLASWVARRASAKTRNRALAALPLLLRIEKSAALSNPYLAIAAVLFALLVIFGTFIFFVDSAIHKGWRHATEIIAEVRKGSTAKVGYPSIQILKLSGEEVAKGFAVTGNATSVVVVSLVEGKVTTRLHALSGDVVVVGRQ